MLRANSALKVRIARLEGRKKRRTWPKLVFAICGHDQPGAFAGYQLAGASVAKLPGETQDECAARAFRLHPHAVTAATLYQAAQECGQLPAAPWPALTASDALSGPENGHSAPANHQRG